MMTDTPHISIIGLVNNCKVKWIAGEQALSCVGACAQPVDTIFKLGKRSRRSLICRKLRVNM